MEKSTQNPPQLNSLAKRLSHAINLLQFKRNFVAESIGISPSALTRIAKGHGNPSEQTLKSLYERVGINTVWLRSGAGAPFTDAASRFIEIRAQAEKGEPSAQWWMYEAYDLGWLSSGSSSGGPVLHLGEDREASYDWLEKAALGGDIDALYSMGMAASRPNRKKYDPKKAIEYLRAAAEKGHEEAMIELGKQYASGELVPISDSLAIEWSARGLLKFGIDPNHIERRVDRITELLPQIHKRVAQIIMEEMVDDGNSETALLRENRDLWKNEAARLQARLIEVQEKRILELDKIHGTRLWETYQFSATAMESPSMKLVFAETTIAELEDAIRRKPEEDRLRAQPIPFFDDKPKRKKPKK